MTQLYVLDDRWGFSWAWRIVPDQPYRTEVRIMPADRYTGELIPGGVPSYCDRSMLRPFTTIARTSDPDTSHAAGQSISSERRRQVHQHILDVLAAHGPCTDFDLARLVAPLVGYPIKQTSVGVRRKELVRLGLVADSGQRGSSDTGATAIRWQITTAGRKDRAA